MKTVILNADDFGASAATNAAILRAHTDGVLTSASLMVNEPAADEAVRIARDQPGLGVGLHVALSDGVAALPGVEIPALVDSTGRFHPNPALAGMRAFFQPAARRQLRAEIAHQVSRYEETGLPCDHLDGHQHLHLHPVIWDAYIPHASQLGARWVRIPYEEFRPASPERLVGRRTEWVFFRVLRKRCVRSLQRAGLSCTDRVYGHLETGHMTEEYVVALLQRLQAASNEIYFHPGTAHAARLTTSAEPMDVELHALISPQFRAGFDQLNIRRVKYGDI